MQNEYRENLSERLRRMSEVSIMDVNPDEVAELKDINIDPELSLGERIMSLVEQSGNPYVYKDCGIVVKVSFANNGKTLQSCMEDYVMSEISLK